MVSLVKILKKISTIRSIFSSYIVLCMSNDLFQHTGQQQPLSLCLDLLSVIGLPARWSSHKACVLLLLKFLTRVPCLQISLRLPLR